MSNYTPTTEDVREAYGWSGHDSYIELNRISRREEFDRWLAEHDRQVAERAWDEGHLVHGADGWPREDGYCRISGGCIAVNPYRKEQENNNA